MTYEEYLRDPRIPEHTEWVDGEVIEMMSVSKKHAELQMYLLELLRSFLRVTKAGRLYTDPFQMRLTNAKSGRAPDIMFVRTERFGDVEGMFLDGPAELVIEIISPCTEGTDRGDKYYEYEAGGVPEYWILDPVRETAEFYLRDDEGVYRSANVPAKGTFASRSLKGFVLTVEWLWTEEDALDAIRAMGLTPR